MNPLSILGVAFGLWATAFFIEQRRRRKDSDDLYNAMMWRTAALDTAAEWIRIERGDVAAKEFRAWANTASQTMLRDHLPAIARKHAARWQKEGVS